MTQRVVQPDGSMIARLRQAKGWSQADLARQAGCNKRTIERLEHSVPVFPRIVRVVAASLDVAPHVLLGEAVHAPTKPGTPSDAPFIAGPPITHPRAFFGREALLRRLFPLWAHMPMQHAALIGPRHSGKTSLLLYLQHITTTAPAQLRPGQRTDWLPQPTRYRWAFVDFQDARLRHLETLLHYLLTTLQLSVPSPCTLEAFMETMSQELHAPTVIVLDDIDVALRKAPDLQADFWESLRALASTQLAGNLAFVVAARDIPAQVAHRQGIDSSFFTLFGYTADVGPFTACEARTLIASAPLSFPEQDVDWILAQSHGWPVLLQILCRERLVALEDGATDDAWRAMGLRQIAPFGAILATQEPPPDVP